jgi:HPt (histidine-containing phosphotransfer) domain-containing protein
LVTSGEARNIRNCSGDASGFLENFMARRDLTGAVDFAHLEQYAAHDAQVVAEVLELFRQQAALWSQLLGRDDAWRDAVHTIKGAAAGVGAHDLVQACGHAETSGRAGVEAVRDALDAALSDVAAYVHEQALRGLRRG